MKARILIAVSIAAAELIGAAQAQPFPSRPLRIVVPFPPGGTADITSRVLAVHMAKGLGQTMVVENRPGGSTIIGTELVARSPADGHTLLVVFPSFVINPALRRGMSFDPMKDFNAVGQTMSVPMAIAVHPSLKANTLEELIALARAVPGQISYGTPGTGTTHHVMGEMLRLATKIDIVHAPFQGGAPALLAVTGGHIPMIYGNATEVAPSVKSGKLRAIVVTSPARAEVLPEVPTMRELGYPELEATNWSGMVVPGATPPSAIARLNAELVQALRNPDTQDKFRSNGMSPQPGTPEEFGAFLQFESSRYAKAVRDAGVKVD
ncbi:MAG TPA: tripartite tricarboxylate transporter substrate binding protein [Burkholderiales bacterium]|jgi:tripartite-type tricarboxylate transporter receptor subunit TctC|nr:tripartite tricarboxylate transporter substrate binding protein [Burkholderiales bacterium]